MNLNFEKFDIFIIGSGISGATLAERYANVMNKKVLVIEKRAHIGGNCHDYFNEDGMLVPRYGPHFFHTNYEDVWKYVSQFTEWIDYEHKVLSHVDGKLVPIPVNIETVNKIFGLNIQTEKDMQKWLEKNVKKIKNPSNSEEASLAKMGPDLYEKLFKNYTKKQWDAWPHELDAAVIDRIPIRKNFDDRYFCDKYQAMPKAGYTEMFKKILSHPNITVMPNTDYFKMSDRIKNYEKIFFTGRIDHFFKDRSCGILPYRSLKFEHENIPKEYFQKTAQINYPNDYEFTRIVEPKHATEQKSELTTIIREYPTWDGEPFYPVPSPASRHIYRKYEKMAERLSARGVHFIGRLANYKYINMDQAFKDALDLFDKLEKNERK